MGSSIDRGYNPRARRSVPAGFALDRHPQLGQGSDSIKE
jgi:hypothetical protein